MLVDLVVHEKDETVFLDLGYSVQGEVVFIFLCYKQSISKKLVEHDTIILPVRCLASPLNAPCQVVYT